MSPSAERSEVIPMIKRHEVQVLLDAGFSHRQVAKRAGVSKRSVTRIAQEPSVESIDEAGLARSGRIGRPSMVGEFLTQVEEILEEEPKLPTVEVFHRMKLKGYKGGKSAVYELVKSVRGPALSRVMVRFEGLAGEFAQFDFGTVRVRYLSGEVETLHFAGYRLKYSRWVYIEVVPSQQVEPWCRVLVRAFESSGGVPLSVVFDNPKTGVIHPKATPIVWNRTMAQLAVDFGFGIELCEPRRANQKGSIENLVGWVKNSFFKVRRFQDREDLLAQLAEWLTEVNEERPCRATGEIPSCCCWRTRRGCVPWPSRLRTTPSSSKSWWVPRAWSPTGGSDTPCRRSQSASPRPFVCTQTGRVSPLGVTRRAIHSSRKTTSAILLTCGPGTWLRSPARAAASISSASASWSWGRSPSTSSPNSSIRGLAPGRATCRSCTSSWIASVTRRSSPHFRQRSCAA